MPVREWDIRIIWLEQRGRWWWNAWHPSTATELYGFTDTQENALRELTAAIKNVRASVAPIAPAAW